MSERRVPRHPEHRPVELWRKGDWLMARCSCALQGAASDIEAHMARINAGAEIARRVAEAAPMMPPAQSIAAEFDTTALRQRGMERDARRAADMTHDAMWGVYLEAVVEPLRRCEAIDDATRSVIPTSRMRRFLRIADETYPAKFINWGAFYAPAIRAAFAQLSERAHGAAAE